MQFLLTISDESNQEGQAQKKGAPAQCLWAVEEQRGRSTVEPGCSGMPG